MERNHHPFRISGAYCLVLTLMLLVLPLKWIFSVMAATLFHELCHWTAIYLCGGSVSFVHFGAGGAKMQMNEMSRGKAMLCALAGPVGSLLLLFLAGVFPRLAICGLIQALYNLLPVFPMDGGRILQGLFSLFLPSSKADRLCDWVGKCFQILILVWGFAASVVYNMGLLPCLVAIYLNMNVFFKNYKLLTNY